MKSSFDDSLDEGSDSSPQKLHTLSATTAAAACASPRLCVSESADKSW